MFKVPWAPPPPTTHTGARTQIKRPLPSPTTPERAGAKTLGGGAPSHCLLPAPQLCSALPTSEAHPLPWAPGRGPAQSVLKLLLGMSSVSHRTPHPLPPPQISRPPPTPRGAPALTPLLPAQPGECGLPATGPRQPVACPAVPAQCRPAAARAWRPEGEVADTQNKTCPVPLTSAPAVWLSLLAGVHLPEAKAAERAGTLLCWPSRATAGAVPPAGTAPKNTPGVGDEQPAAPWGRASTVRTGLMSMGLPKASSSRPADRAKGSCPHMGTCIYVCAGSGQGGCPQVSYQSQSERNQPEKGHQYPPWGR